MLSATYSSKRWAQQHPGRRCLEHWMTQQLQHIQAAGMRHKMLVAATQDATEDVGSSNTRCDRRCW
jgi:hypothetical protein